MKEWLSFIANRRTGGGASAILGVLAPLAVLNVQAVQAASFDCSKAATTVEKTICAEAELSKLDEELAKAYTEALARAQDPNGLKSRQRAWLHAVRDACTGTACLKPAYVGRIWELSHVGRAFDTYGNSLDADGLPLGPGGAVEKSGAFVDFEITKGAGLALCRGVEKGLRQKALVPSSFELCGVPFPVRDNDFQRLAEWQEIEPSRHMKIVQEIFYFSNIRKAQIGEADWKRQWEGDAILPDMFERIWLPSRERINALIAKGRIRLQSNLFDIDNDGNEETVYRMTELRLQPLSIKNADGGWEETLSLATFAPKECRRSVPGWDDAPYVYMIEKGGRRSMLPRHNSVMSGFAFFRYRGRLYYAFNGDSVINEAVPAPPDFPGIMFQQVCHFGLKMEQY